MENDKKQDSIAGSFVWKFCERLVSQGVTFLVSLILARLLTPDDYGVIAIVMVFINLSSVFIVSGFSSALIQKKDANQLDFSTIFYCSIVCSFFIYGCIYIGAQYISLYYNLPLLEPVLKILGLQIPLSVYNTIQNAYIARHMLFKSLFFSTLISVIFSGIVGVALATLGYGVWALVFQSLFFTFCSTLTLLFVAQWRPKLEFSVQSVKVMLKYSSLILATDLSGTFFSEVRGLVIGKAFTSSDLAFYSRGQQLPSIVTGNVGTTLISILFPALAREQGNLDNIKLLTKKSLIMLSFVLVPSMLGLVAIMEPLVVLLYTSKWSECIIYAQIICIGSVFSVLGLIPLQVLKAIGRSDVLLQLEFIKKPAYVISLMVGAQINLIAVAILMMIYDFYGALLNMVKLKKYINYGVCEQIADILPTIILSAIMSFIVYNVPFFESSIITIFLKMLFGIIFYVGSAMYLKIEGFIYFMDYLKKRFL